MSAAFTRVMQVSELPDGEKKVVDIAGKPVLVCNSGDKLFAVSNICSHAEEKLENGRMKRGVIVCPVHGARFDLASGAALCAPAARPIATYPVRVVDDWIEVAV